MQKTMVLAIGEALIDAVSTNFVDDLSAARQIQMQPGGSAANFCRYLHELGTAAKLVAAIGADGLGSIILNDLQQKGIDHTELQLVDHAPTTLILVGKNTGTPDFIPYRGADQFIGKISDSLIQHCDLMHTTAFALSKEPAQTNILAALVKGKAADKQLSIDWNYAEKIWGKDNNAKAVFNDVMKLSPLLKFSLDDASRFFKSHLDATAARRKLDQYPTSFICLTCGSEGVWYKAGNDDWKQQKAKPVSVKDSTGAGDSFWAGFMHAYLQQQPFDDCISNALETAALKLEGKFS
jgi:fructokinase